MLSCRGVEEEEEACPRDCWDGEEGVKFDWLGRAELMVADFGGTSRVSLLGTALFAST